MKTTISEQAPQRVFARWVQRLRFAYRWEFRSVVVAKRFQDQCREVGKGVVGLFTALCLLCYGVIMVGGGTIVFLLEPVLIFFRPFVQCVLNRKEVDELQRRFPSL